MDDDVWVAGPDTAAFISEHSGAAKGIRFRPGVLPRLLGVPAVEVRNSRVALDELRPKAGGGSLQLHLTLADNTHPMPVFHLSRPLRVESTRSGDSRWTDY